MSTPTFYPHDFQSDAWGRMKVYLEAELAELRAQLEAPGLDDKPTSSTRLRAKITLLKEILSLPERVKEEGERAHTTT